MAFKLPPPPNTTDLSSFAWKDWLYKLQGFLASAIDLSNVTGTLAVGHGGTGLDDIPDDGQLLIGNGIGYSLNTLTAGDNIVITNGSGTIEIAASGGGDNTVSYTAGEDLGGDRLVYIDASGEAKYASNDVLTNTNIVLGITTGAATTGNLVQIQIEGEYEEPTWSWTLEQPIFLGTNGLLTQTQPTTPAFALVVGFPITSTKILIRFNNPIVLA